MMKMAIKLLIITPWINFWIKIRYLISMKGKNRNNCKNMNQK